eukprot:Partr_v1_DN26540_c0_g1_i2_m3408
MPTSANIESTDSTPVQTNKMVFNDNRGSLHSFKGFQFATKEILISHSYAGVVRGLHCSPYQKHIYVTKGRIYDFWYVPGTEQKFEGILAAGDNLLIPPGAMHGFYAIEEVDMLYFLADQFDPALDKSYHWTSPGLPLKLEFPHDNVIVSKKDESAPFFHQVDFLLLGAKGYLGSYTETVLKQQGRKFLSSNERLENLAAIERLIAKSGCKYVICAAGISGRPTTAWCEDHERETYQVNYVQMINLMELTDKLGVHFTYYGTGLLYSPKIGKSIFDESDKPDLDNSVYIRYRVELESHLRLYPKVLCLRILYPTTADGHPKCFLTKMKERTESVHNASVAITVVPDLFPHIPRIIEAGTVGPLNFVNAGTITLPNLLSTFNVKHKVASPELKPGIEFSTARLSKASGRETPVVSDVLRGLSG